MLTASLSEQDAIALRRDVQRELCNRRLAHFIRLGWHVLEPGVRLDWNWHIEAIADHVQWVLEDWMCWQLSQMHSASDREEHAVRIFGTRRAEDLLPTLGPGFKQRARNLLINVPPGTAKSRITSVFAPAWMWLPSKWPSWRVLCLSANPDVAIRDARYCRDLLTSDWYQDWFEPEWTMREDQDALGNYGNTAGGARSSKGLNAKVTGQRGDAIIVDDPHDLKEAHSDTIRKTVVQNWKDSAANRVNDLRSSVRIGIMQRVHEDDWSGYVLSEGDWAHLCLPMEFDPERACRTVFGWQDPRTQPGQIIHEARFTPDVLAAEKRRLGSYGYASQMQQRPAPAEGGMFKRSWWRFWKPDGLAANGSRPRGCYDGPAVPLPVLDSVLISVDCAFKDLDTGSNVGLIVVGAKGSDRYVLADFTRPMDVVETCRMIVEARNRHPRALKVIIEEKANGAAVMRMLRGVVSGIKPVNPEGGKESRAAACQPTVEAGDVYLMDGAPWLDDFIGELSTFPNGAKNDRVDALTQALIEMQGSVDATRFLAAWG